MKRLILAVVLAMAAAFTAFADPLEPFGFVKQITQNDGDSLTTKQVTVTSSGVLISDTQTKLNRKRVLQNTGNYTVYLGSFSAVGASTGFPLISSTTYTTYGTGAIYGYASSNSVVAVIQETNSAY